MPNKIISKVETIHVSLTSPTRMLEVGIQQASDTAYIRFGFDDCGHADVKGWERSCCSVVVEFEGLRMSGGMGGCNYDLTFKAWCEKYEEE